ncbi:uncharacterized protein [Primulina huaijiensis]|uniref:uncharacterized protein isoform X3 n=1 Tax=Primulina huaijiensis TaxID=1492673 RepID=UPI003CC790E2
MKTGEKKYKPVALHVNYVHYSRDPVSCPWSWSWKDVSTKVQNMRHQYALVKQKIKKQESSVGGTGEEEFDWMEGTAHWSNFLRSIDHNLVQRIRIQPKIQTVDGQHSTTVFNLHPEHSRGCYVLAVCFCRISHVKKLKGTISPKLNLRPVQSFC